MDGAPPEVPTDEGWRASDDMTRAADCRTRWVGHIEKKSAAVSPRR